LVLDLTEVVRGAQRMEPRTIPAGKSDDETAVESRHLSKLNKNDEDVMITYSKETADLDCKPVQFNRGDGKSLHDLPGMHRVESCTNLVENNIVEVNSAEFILAVATDLPNSPKLGGPLGPALVG
jgi:hypothetical protein